MTNAWFPLISGIEAAGTVDLAPGGEFAPGQQVVVVGVDHPIVDDGNVAEKVRAILPDGVHTALELVGTNVLPDTLKATAVRGTVCFTGMLSDTWTIPDFYPMDYLPNGVRLTAYGGESSDLPAETFQRYVDLVAAGKLPIRIDRVFTMDEIGEAHRIMQDGKAVGKLVVQVE
ncbi:NADPH:quinone reductase-like Zn-dependent oxidoreductase [Kribbella aluminosa]|uniref:NADPH:quinone reductase-like Zn-dependent oxidoreductase n=1 Tax=Kribbella aluminosa TaxID=416017 RepID=A0ABS4UQV0_9ACTN|nr:zinc-binding dehydrogenase [Kribbella aluminosa]MBP2354019.1 NADPH:quinone reductase-like Zn-dependent oxidoreductase [Kribbella aluminosa]